MKKIFFMMAMAAMVAVSCQKDGDKGNTGNNGDEGTNPPANENYTRLFDDFEDGGLLEWNGNGGATVAVVENPSKTGINTSESVCKVTHGGAQWEIAYSAHFMDGTTTDYVNFSEDGYIVRVDVYSPKANNPVYLKFEGDNVPNVEIQNVKTTKANEWETLEFDYEPYNIVDGAYRNLVIVFDAGAVTTVGESYYFDNVRLCAE